MKFISTPKVCTQKKFQEGQFRAHYENWIIIPLCSAMKTFSIKYFFATACGGGSSKVLLQGEEFNKLSQLKLEISLLLFQLNENILRSTGWHCTCVKIKISKTSVGAVRKLRHINEN